MNHSDKDEKIIEFRNLTASIRKESEQLKKVILSEEEDKAIGRIFDNFDMTAQIQSYSTMNHLAMYQLKLWRDLADGGNSSGDGE